MANIGAGLIQGIPVSTSLSASSANDIAGARSPVASLSTGAIVILTLIVLAPVFTDLPKPVLAAVIIDAVVMGMMDVPEMKRLRRVKRSDFWIAMAAILGVLSFGVLAGIVIGVILSVGWLVYVSTSPAMPVLGRMRGSGIFREHEPHRGEQLRALALRLDGGLFYATADARRSRPRFRDERVAFAVVSTAPISRSVDSRGPPSPGNELARERTSRSDWPALPVSSRCYRDASDSDRRTISTTNQAVAI
jgi:MFS superfamily sulfate permease-like transporter